MGIDDNAQHPEREEESESFADLFEAYTSGMKEDLQVGDRIQGEIIAIGKDSAFVNTGTKIDGVVDLDELRDEEGRLACEVGDPVELYVVDVLESELRLSRALSGVGGRAMLEEAYRQQMPVEGTVQETCKGGFRIEMLKHRAFCPVSQIDLHYVENPEDYVGDTFEFRIVRFEAGGRNLVVSRRVLLEAHQKAAEKAFFQNLAEGQVLEGTVTRLMPYGAFVELIPGVEGMIHISEMQWSRTESPDQCVQPGDTVRVKVIDITVAGKSGRPKIALSMKQLAADPWETVTQTCKPGDRLTGRVTRCAAFGAFVEIAPGLEGLVHISEMSYVKRVLKPEDVVRVGQEVPVVVQNIDAAGRRISLSMREAEGDPWQDVSEKFRIGQRLPGLLEKKERFGFFICLEPGITGLLPKSKMRESALGSEFEKYKIGDTIPVVVEDIQPPERKITLAPAESSSSENWQPYAENDPSPVMGDLGAKLQAALKRQSRDKS